MAITLFHHPFSRARGTLWALEEVGCDYDLAYVDLKAGEQNEPSIKEMNPMGKLPTLVDGEIVVTEAAAIAIYLADRYAPGKLAPALDAPERATFLRWSFYAPSVIEPCAMAHAANWNYRPQQAGFGTYEAMLDTLSAAIGTGPWLLGEQFSMADVIFGGTIQFMVGFDMLEKRPEYVAYAERLAARPAAIKAQAINAKIVSERGLGT